VLTTEGRVYKCRSTFAADFPQQSIKGYALSLTFSLTNLYIFTGLVVDSKAAAVELVHCHQSMHYEA
jgi:hypothetical protein